MSPCRTCGGSGSQPSRMNMCWSCCKKRQEGAQEECECGNHKRLGDEACKRCQFLDGEIHRDPRVSACALIATLRQLGGSAMVEAIRLELGIDNPSDERQLHRVVARLKKQGRLSVFQEPPILNLGWRFAGEADVKRNRDGSPVVPGSSMKRHGPKQLNTPPLLVLVERAA